MIDRAKRDTPTGGPESVLATDLSRPQLQTMMYLMLSVAGSMTIYLTRTRGPFWSIRPARKLMMAVTGAQIIATVISVGGIFVTALPWKYTLLVWCYALVWFLVTDRVKLLAYRLLDPATTATATASSSPEPTRAIRNGAVGAYHTTSREHSPSHRAVYHTDDACPYGQEITAAHRRDGTAGRVLCTHCAEQQHPVARDPSAGMIAVKQRSHMSQNDEAAKAGPDANGGNASGDPQPSRAATPWPHSRAEAEMREIIHALSGNHVLTLAQIKELCWASHWPESDFTATLHRAVAAGEIKQLSEDLYEIPESRRHNP